MKIFNCTAISDTHTTHRMYDLPGGDILFFCGDWGERGTFTEFWDLCDWLREQDYRYKVMVGGNHDQIMSEDLAKCRKVADPSIILQENDVEIEGLRIFGSPMSLKYAGWAFEYTEKQIADLIHLWSDHNHVVITHGPAFSMVDFNGKNPCGSENLLVKLQQMSFAKMKLHLCGHIHEAYGVREKYGFTSINSAILGQSATGPIKDPINFEIHFNTDSDSIEKIIVK